MIVYTTNHNHSRVICRAFALGHNGRMVPPLRLLDGPGMFYGILRGCGDLMKECDWTGREYYYVDHGFFRRGYYDGYFRVCRNGRFPGNFRSCPSDRWEALGTELRPWRRSGSHVVVCPISAQVGDFLGIDTERWTASVVREISLHTDRPIIVKPKDGEPLKDVLEDAWCLVTHSSNSAVDAVVAGIPAVVLGGDHLGHVGWTLRNIESPIWPDRESWVHWLAYNQFTLEEMRRGLNLAAL